MVLTDRLPTIMVQRRLWSLLLLVLVWNAGHTAYAQNGRSGEAAPLAKPQRTGLLAPWSRWVESLRAADQPWMSEQDRLVKATPGRTDSPVVIRGQSFMEPRANPFPTSTGGPFAGTVGMTLPGDFVPPSAPIIQAGATEMAQAPPGMAPPGVPGPVIMDPMPPISGDPFLGGSDPFAMQGSPYPFAASGPVWYPYAAQIGKFGNQSTAGISQVVVPLIQDGRSMLFADLRARYNDTSGYQGSFGGGVRSIMNNQWIYGINGFYDLTHTGQGNNFSNGTVGLEIMSVINEFRVNGYIPDRHMKTVTGGGGVFANGTVVYNNSNGFGDPSLVRAYYGFDSEYGALLYDDESGNVELRGYAGGYYFDTNRDGSFDRMIGPKTRLEFRHYDLPHFGPGSRLTVGVEYAWDRVRNDQWAALVRFEIPLGFTGARPLSRLERRMLDRIVRDNE